MADQKVTILIAPLDWGLGHITRCLPLVQECLRLQCRVIVACNSKQKEILDTEFPGISTEKLEGYDLTYGKNRIRTIFRIISQAPKILTKIKEEHRWLEKFLENEKIDLVISDNRFGLYSKNARTVFITHQLFIKSGLGHWLDRWLQKRNYRYINRYSSCWIPDYPGPENLAGDLSHPKIMPSIPYEYIGALSRFTRREETTDRIPLLIVLSGLEPQRSLFESLLLQQLEKSEIRTVMVRGVPESEQLPRTPDHVLPINFASTEKLNLLLCRADLVCCRSGYSSIMDILKLQKRSILVPTPGQAEQRYLGQHMSRQQLALVIRQDRLQLSTALKRASQFPYRFIPAAMNQYREVLARWISGTGK